MPKVATTQIKTTTNLISTHNTKCHSLFVQLFHAQSAWRKCKLFKIGITKMSTTNMKKEQHVNIIMLESGSYKMARPVIKSVGA